MKLRNKKTGEIVELEEFSVHYKKHYDYGEGRKGEQPYSTYNKTLAELNEEWEDYEEPKKYWYISDGGEVYGFSGYFVGSEIEEAHREIGNLFETREEAEKAVEKLKAWKRLKDFGCRFILDDYFAVKFIGPDATKITSAEEQKSLSDNYKLLFGGEE